MNPAVPTRFHQQLMSNPVTQQEKLGPLAKRSVRSAWAEALEPSVRSKAPFPLAYDVNAGQPMNFSEYSYTELAGGMWITTQSCEMNCRLIQLASQEVDPEPLVTLALFAEVLADKYELAAPTKTYRRVCFLPGQNLIELASIEIMSRIVHEEEDVMFKLHPVTGDEAIDQIRKRLGWNRILPRTESGMGLLRGCEEVFVTSASEMAITGTVLGKQIHNVSNFFHEGSGAYHPISRLLFTAQKQGVDVAQQLLANIVSCPWSGVLMPWHDNVEARIDAYYAKSLELREQFKPLAAPRWNPKAKEAAK